MKFIILLILFNITCYSQVDSIKCLYNIQLTGLYNSGNNNSLILNTNNNIIISNNTLKNSTQYNYMYGIQSSSKISNEHYLNNSLSYNLKNKLSLISLLEMEKSYMRSIDIRSVYGIGIGYKLNNSISISNLFLIDDTKYQSYYLNIYRSSIRIKIKHDSSRFKFNTETYLQPDIAMKYFRLRSNTNIGYKINNKVSFIFNIQDTYEQFVMNGKSHNDLNISVGVSFSNI